MKKIIAKIIAKLYGVYFDILSYVNPTKTGHVAFNALCTVRKKKVFPYQKDYLEAAKSDVLSLENHTIQTYKWQGDKDTVLLIHGWESNSWRWIKLVQKLQKANFNIIAFDAPGHGYSSGHKLYVPLYAKVLREVIKIYNPKHLVGHSIGGMTIMYNEYFHPSSMVDKIVTIGSPSEFYKILDFYQNLLGFHGKVRAILEAYFKKRFSLNVREFSIATYAKTNTKKGLLFHDRLDTVTPYHASTAVHEQWRGSELISTEGLGHSMHQDEVNEKIVSFLKN